MRTPLPPVRLGNFCGWDELNLLMCPCCGADEAYLHSRTVTVFDRAEDAEITRVVSVGETVDMRRVPSEATGNPSSRRHGIAIEFECELCGEPIELTFAQHKGHTLVRWRRR